MQNFIFERNYSFFVAFAQDFHRVSVEVDRRFFESDDFGESHSGLVEELQEHLVAPALEVVAEIGGVVDCGGFFFGVEYGQASRQPRSGDFSHYVGFDPLLAPAELEEGADGGEHGALRVDAVAALGELHLPVADFEVRHLSDVGYLAGAGQEGGEMGKGVAIGPDGARRKTPFGPDIQQESFYCSI